MDRRKAEWIERTGGEGHQTIRRLEIVYILTSVVTIYKMKSGQSIAVEKN